MLDPIAAGARPEWPPADVLEAVAKMEVVDSQGVDTWRQECKDRGKVLDAMLARPQGVDARHGGGKSGMTLLMSAGGGGQEQLVAKLLALGASTDLQAGGWSALMYATHNGHAHIVRLLLAAGADVTLRNFSGKSALYWAEHSQYPHLVPIRPEMVRLLRSAEARASARAHWRRHARLVGKALLAIREEWEQLWAVGINRKWEDVRFRPEHSGAAAAAASFYSHACMQTAQRANAPDDE